MSVSRIAERYAKSLLEYAIESNSLEQVVDDVALLRKSLESRDLFLLIKSPIIDTSKKRSIFSKLFDDKVGPVMRSFSDIIMRKGRENVLPEMLTSFDILHKIYQKVSTVTLTTAAPLSDEALSKISSTLEGSHSTQKNVELETKVDPELIGGFRLEFEDKQYDNSIAAKLKELRNQFSKNNYQNKL